MYWLKLTIIAIKCQVQIVTSEFMFTFVWTEAGNLVIKSKYIDMKLKW